MLFRLKLFTLSVLVGWTKGLVTKLTFDWGNWTRRNKQKKYFVTRQLTPSSRVWWKLKKKKGNIRMQFFLWHLPSVCAVFSVQISWLPKSISYQYSLPLTNPQLLPVVKRVNRIKFIFVFDFMNYNLFYFSLCFRPALTECGGAQNDGGDSSDDCGSPERGCRGQVLLRPRVCSHGSLAGRAPGLCPRLLLAVGTTHSNCLSFYFLSVFILFQFPFFFLWAA